MSNNLFGDEAETDGLEKSSEKQEEYRVIARRYRPKTFSEVIGQEHVTRTLKNSIEEGRLGHAYLFSGPRGIGKTSTARILARAVNCEKGISPEPCNECSVCRELEVGNTPDIIEIDAASQRGIDDIRSLRENVRYSPLQCTYRVYIIDEAHMLSRDAFNAFLKTLEEPPDHVIFVFATTEPEKMPDTIRSRCQQFAFRRISHQDMLDRLTEIAENEELDVPTQILSDICRASDGALRDAQSLLDQLISISGGKIEEQELKLVLGTVTTDVLFEILHGMKERDSKHVLEQVHRVYEGGGDLDVFLNQFLNHLRNLLVVQKCGKGTDLVRGTEEEREEFARQADWFSERELANILETLIEVRNRTKNLFQSRLLLESAFVRICKGLSGGHRESSGPEKKTEPPEASSSAGDRATGGSDRLSEQEGTYGEEEGDESPEEDSGNARTDSGDTSPGNGGEKRNETSSARQDPNENESEDSGANGEEGGGQKENENEREEDPHADLSPDSDLEDVWNFLVVELKKQNHSTIAALLSEGEPRSLDEEELRIWFDEPFEYHRNKLEQENRTHIIKRVVGNVLGSSPEITFLPEKDEGETSGEDDKKEKKSPRKRAQDDPNVKKAQEFFNADIINIEENDNEPG